MISREPLFYRNLQEKCRGPDWAQNADTHFVRACAIEMHFNISQETSEEPPYTKIRIQEKCRGPDCAQNAETHTHTLREPPRSKRMSRFHKSHVIRKFTGKMPQNAADQTEPRTRTNTCASLRSRNACQDFTRATFCGNWPVKCRRPEWAPWSSTGLRRNPSVWTHCLGNQSHKVRGGQ